MRAYVIREGDYLTKLAALRGFSAEAVWDDPQNAGIRSLRENMDILLPGDVVYLPEDTRGPQPLERGASNCYVADTHEVTVSLVLRRNGKPLAGEPYEVRGLPEPIKHEAGPDGRITFAVPVVVGEVEVFLPRRNEIQPVLVGHLAPETTRAGACDRLANLGYFGPRWDHAVLEDEEALTRAVRMFQIDHRLPATGKLDGGTAEALRAAHGS